MGIYSCSVLSDTCVLCIAQILKSYMSETSCVKTGGYDISLNDQSSDRHPPVVSNPVVKWQATCSIACHDCSQATQQTDSSGSDSCSSDDPLGK